MSSVERVATFLRVLDQVYPSGHPDLLITTGAATPLLLSDLRALVSATASNRPTDEMIERGMEASVLGRASVDDPSYVLSIWNAMLAARGQS